MPHRIEIAKSNPLDVGDAGRRHARDASGGVRRILFGMRALFLAASAGACLAVGAAAASMPVQHGLAQGVRVDVYRPGSAVFDLSRAAATPRRLLTGPSGLAYGCLHVSFRRGRWHSLEYSQTGRFRRRLRFRWPGARAPYDGCELGGLYGHRWDDAFGTRNAVEIWLTVRGRHFFNDRAAARDLAYFVRSRRAQRIRLSANPRPALEALVRRYARRRRVVEVGSPNARAPEDSIGFWIGPRTIVFTTTSSTGRGFYVVAKRRTLELPAHNLADLAFVF
jgi:hypothetical protein